MSANMRTLREACDAVAAQATNQEAKRQLTAMSHDAIKSMGELIQRSADWSNEGRRTTANNAHTVNTHVSQLVRFVTSGTQFAGQPAVISSEAREVRNDLKLKLPFFFSF